MVRGSIRRVGIARRSLTGTRGTSSLVGEMNIDQAVMLFAAYSVAYNRLYSSVYGCSNEGHREGFESFRCYDL